MSTSLHIRLNFKEIALPFKPYVVLLLVVRCIHWHLQQEPWDIHNFLSSYVASPNIMSNVFSHPYQLVESIFNFKAIGRIFHFYSNFKRKFCE